MKRFCTYEKWAVYDSTNFEEELLFFLHWFTTFNYTSPSTILIVGFTAQKDGKSLMPKRNDLHQRKFCRNPTLFRHKLFANIIWLFWTKNVMNLFDSTFILEFLYRVQSSQLYPLNNYCQSYCRQCIICFLQNAKYLKWYKGALLSESKYVVRC